MKTNFKKSKNPDSVDTKKNDENVNISKEEFEEYIIKSGAKGSFMVYRSDKKEEELGIDEL